MSPIHEDLFDQLLDMSIKTSRNFAHATEFRSERNLMKQPLEQPCCTMHVIMWCPFGGYNIRIEYSRIVQMSPCSDSSRISFDQDHIMDRTGGFGCNHMINCQHTTSNSLVLEPYRTSGPITACHSDRLVIQDIGRYWQRLEMMACSLSKNAPSPVCWCSSIRCGFKC